jgi:hypothetical protein
LKIAGMILGIGWWLTISLVEAGPPFVTDDPEPPSPGGWEINVPFIFERTAGKTEMDAPLLDLNYGLPEVQLKLEFPVKIAEDDKTGTSIVSKQRASTISTRNLSTVALANG